jgi:hypothetical protein
VANFIAVRCLLCLGSLVLAYEFGNSVFTILFSHIARSFCAVYVMADFCGSSLSAMFWLVRLPKATRPATAILRGLPAQNPLPGPILPARSPIGGKKKPRQRMGSCRC